METQTFNVLCVSKIADETTNWADRWHLPSWAPKATLRVDFDEVLGVKIPKPVVAFGYHTFKLLGVTVGLSGACVALVLETDEPGYKKLKLYTDRPAHDDETTEDVLRQAELEITAKGHSLDSTKRLGWWPSTAEHV